MIFQMMHKTVYSGSYSLQLNIFWKKHVFCLFDIFFFSSDGKGDVFPFFNKFLKDGNSSTSCFESFTYGNIYREFLSIMFQPSIIKYLFPSWPTAGAVNLCFTFGNVNAELSSWWSFRSRLHLLFFLLTNERRGFGL